MELYTTDAKGRKYKIDIETDRFEDVNISQVASDVSMRHYVTVTGEVGRTSVWSREETDAQELLDSIFDTAQAMIKEWNDGQV